VSRHAFVNPNPLRALALCAVTVCALLTFDGCESKTGASPRRGPAAQADAQGGLFDLVAENLDHLEQFDTNQILKQVCDRLNQWYLQEKPKVVWQRDPLVETLSPELRNLLPMQLLDAMQFRISDAWFLQESVWMRDISKRARADQFQDLAVAERLFDWTVQNIQLEPEVDPKARQLHRHRPFETLLYGRGQALERAWVFLLLARQQGLDVVLLGLADEDGKSVRPWLPALLSGEELYLFDCRLGLPIPGPQGQGVATLAQVAADEQLLRRLDWDDEHPYPVHGEDLKRVVAYVEASPANLSRRMALVESRLTGKHKMVLTSPGSALIERLKKIPQVAKAQVWPLPFDISLWESKLSDVDRQAAVRELLMFQALPALTKARALYFKGAYDGETGAKTFYLSLRPPDTYLDTYKLPPELAKQFPQESHARIEASQVLMMKHAKQDASFWLGLVALAEQDYPTAVDFFSKRTLESSPRGPWTAAARYNLARTYEAAGDVQQAVVLYESDTQTPQSHGNHLRARWLKERQAKAEAK
jgi:tetratricopeptide (TPR) repeat protein